MQISTDPVVEENVDGRMYRTRTLQPWSVQLCTYIHHRAYGHRILMKTARYAPHNGFSSKRAAAAKYDELRESTLAILKRGAAVWVRPELRARDETLLYVLEQVIVRLLQEMEEPRPGGPTAWLGSVWHEIVRTVGGNPKAAGYTVITPRKFKKALEENAERITGAVKNYRPRTPVDDQGSAESDQ